MVVVWLTALVIFLAAEALTVGLVSIWFAGGALISMILAALGAPLWLQICMFMLSSCILLILTKPFAEKYFSKNRVPTNAEALIGRTAIVTEDINNDETVGAVKVNGQIWSAYTESGAAAKKGDKLTVVNIQGVHLIVK